MLTRAAVPTSSCHAIAQSWPLTQQLSLPLASCFPSRNLLFALLRLVPLPFLHRLESPPYNPTSNPKSPNVLSFLKPNMTFGSTSSSNPGIDGLQEAISQYHTNTFPDGRCGAMHMQHIAAPASTVWSLVGRFDSPQSYKRFIRSCRLVSGDGATVGSVREVRVVSGLPADVSTERLDTLDDDKRLISFSIVGGDHRLKNYRSMTTVHEAEGGKTIVVESYVVDVPPGSTEEETCIFADTIVRCNLKSLAEVAVRRARQSSSRG